MSDLGGEVPVPFPEVRQEDTSVIPLLEANVPGMSHAYTSRQQGRPMFVYETEAVVEKLLVLDKAQAAHLLALMLRDGHELDGWTPIIDWEALGRFGIETAGSPIVGTHNYRGMENEEDIDDADTAMRKFFAPDSIAEDSDEKTFVASHNTDIATMQRWTEWFADYPVARQLRLELSIIRDALELAPSDPANYWAEYKRPSIDPKTK